ncbi:MAG: hypothetical protein JXQ83_00405 [Candidatus Glassbacteria bacterium]|nr:hypothetical protein [Candidatus Glassbacteria bacterium]
MPMNTFRDEVGRKVIHVLIIFFPCVYFFFAIPFGHREGLLALVALLVLGIILEYLRLEHRVRLPLLSWLWDNFRREKEEEHMGAEIYTMLGVIVALAVFDLRVAVAAIMMTVFGDLTACLVGMRFGSIRPAAFRGKSVEGAAVALVANLAVGFIFLRTCAGGSVWWWQAMQDPEWLFSGAGFGEPLWPVIPVMALAAAAVELLISKINDNLTIPVISGLAGQVTLSALSG